MTSTRRAARTHRDARARRAQRLEGVDERGVGAHVEKDVAREDDVKARGRRGGQRSAPRVRHVRRRRQPVQPEVVRHLRLHLVVVHVTRRHVQPACAHAEDCQRARRSPELQDAPPREPLGAVGANPVRQRVRARPHGVGVQGVERFLAQTDLQPGQRHAALLRVVAETAAAFVVAAVREQAAQRDGRAHALVQPLARHCGNAEASAEAEDSEAAVAADSAETEAGQARFKGLVVRRTVLYAPPLPPGAMTTDYIARKRAKKRSKELRSEASAEASEHTHDGPVKRNRKKRGPNHRIRKGACFRPPPLPPGLAAEDAAAAAAERRAKAGLVPRRVRKRLRREAAAAAGGGAPGGGGSGSESGGSEGEAEEEEEDDEPPPPKRKTAAAAKPPAAAQPRSQPHAGAPPPPSFAAALAALGHAAATAIQRDVWAAALAGRDAVAVSPPGTGKTLAYLLPALHAAALAGGDAAGAGNAGACFTLRRSSACSAATRCALTHASVFPPFRRCGA